MGNYLIKSRNSEKRNKDLIEIHIQKCVIKKNNIYLFEHNLVTKISVDEIIDKNHNKKYSNEYRNFQSEISI